VNEDGAILPALPLPRRAENPEVRAFLKSGGKKLKSKRKGADNFCCLKHSVGVYGATFNRDWGTCPRDNRRLAAERLTKMTFKPASDAGRPWSLTTINPFSGFIKVRPIRAVQKTAAIAQLN